MRKPKRGNDGTGSFRKNKKTCNTEPTVSGILVPTVSGRLDMNQKEGVWTGISDEQKSCFSRSVASITLCTGDRTLFSCSGIAVDRQGYDLSTFMTSASLVKALDGTSNDDHMDLKIQVRHEGNEVYTGFLADYDLAHNFAIVNVRNFLDVHVGLQHVLEIPPYGVSLSLALLGRDISGKVITRTVKLSDDLRIYEDDEDCQTSEAWEGGPLFSFDGNFVGMNLFLSKGRTFFLPWNIIFDRLKQKKIALVHSKSLKVCRPGARPIGKEPNSHLEVHRDLNQEQLDLDSMGYPKLPSTMSGAGMILVNTFEETFGDIYGQGVWSKLSKKASSNLNRSVVALASFNGEKRYFACTGFFIEWNGSMVILTSASLVRNSVDEDKIVENLRIEVLLPHNQCRKGKLQDYCLHYNIALVSVIDYHARRPANGLLHWKSTGEVAAVGRCFKSGALMATTGNLVPWSGTLDCNVLIHSSCKITKAGIGGPLVTLDGDVIGMNFYDKKIGTPFLSWKFICNILDSFERKSEPGDAGNDSGSSVVAICKVAGANKYMLNIKPGDVGGSSSMPYCKMTADDKLNRWPVPMPCWRHCDYVDENGSDDDEDECDYEDGEKFTLF